MDSQPSRARAGRIAALVRPRLTFSNLTALLALFVALGGSSYAAIRVGSDEIADDSVRGRDIHKDTVRGTDVRDNDLQGRDIRDGTISGADVKESSLGRVALAADAGTLGGRTPSSFLAADKVVRVGPVKLSKGESATVASTGPFTWKAQCSDAGVDGIHLKVVLESTEANSLTGSFGTPAGEFSPGSPAVLFDSSSTTPGYMIAFPLSATAPSGAAPVGLAFVGISAAGADCVVNGLLLP